MAGWAPLQKSPGNADKAAWSKPATEAELGERLRTERLSRDADSDPSLVRACGGRATCAEADHTISPVASRSVPF